MKTIQDIMDPARPVGDIIADLTQKTTLVPEWERLRREYDERLHPVFTDPAYRDDPARRLRLTRISLGWPRLAVKRMGEMLFGLPVRRQYHTTRGDDRQQRAREAIEAIYRRLHIDALNISRARALYAACEFATIYYATLQPTQYASEQSPLRLRTRTYSPLTGETLYPLFDDFDDLIALSVDYQRTLGRQTVRYFETYTAEEHARWRTTGGGTWEEDTEREPIAIGKISGVYAHRPLPIWENEIQNVYEAEWTLSRNGNYIRKNAKPTFIVQCDMADLAAFKQQESDGDPRAVREALYLPKDANARYETWQQSTEATKFQVEQLRQNYFRQLQLPDMSFEAMKTAPMSGESRKMMFIDAQLKVLDEAGPWRETLEREASVIRAYALHMFPELATEIAALDIDHLITPYHIDDQGEQAKIAQTLTAGKALLSQRTAIERYADVADPDDELRQIQAEEAAANEQPALL